MLLDSIRGPTGRWVVALFIWLAGAFVTELVWGGRLFAELAVVIGLVAAYGTAGWLILSKRSLIPVEERLPWSLLAIGMLMVAGGMVIMVVGSLLSPRVGAFGPIDLVFLAAYTIGLVGFARLPQLKTAIGSRRRLLLDGLIGAGSIAALMWVFVGESIAAELAGSMRWDLVIGSIYPVLDLAGFVVVMLVVLRRSNFRFDPRLMAVGITFFVQGFGDVLYFRAGIGMGFLEADPLYSLHLVAAASIVVCGLLVERAPAPREVVQRETPLASLLAPYGAALILIGLTAGRFVTTARLDTGSRVLLVASFVVVVLVVLRQFLAIRENSQLVESERDALVSSISHELRTPLTAVVGYLELLTEPGAVRSEDETRDLLLTSRDQAGQLSRIVFDLVLAARDTPTAIQLDRRTVRLRPLLQEVVRQAEGFAGSIELDCPEHLTAVVDPERVGQALANLVDNAQRYGGTRCRLVARSADRNLVLEVHDDGPGVPERYRELIWKRFERGTHRLDAARPGSGIGLALVKIIAGAHDGISAYRPSTLLGGACFAIVVPEGAAADGRSRGRHDPASGHLVTESRQGAVEDVAASR